MTEVIEHVNKVYTVLQPSKIEGVGTFAIKPIKKNTDIFPGWSHSTGFYKVNLKEDTLDKKIIPTLLKFYTLVEDTVEVFLVGGVNHTTPWRHYVNHSNIPNISNTGIALRDIQEGEEILRNYQIRSTAEKTTVI